MKRIILLVFCCWLIAGIQAQVETSPSFIKEGIPVKITYDASKGTGGLKGYTGNVYAHTGLITDQSTGEGDWKYAPAWGDNAAKYKLTRVSTDVYELEIEPDIRAYYGAAAGDKILRLAFVFRSEAPVNGAYLEGKALGGKDIFVDMPQNSFEALFFTPEFNQIIEPDSLLRIRVKASAAAHMEIRDNGNLVRSLTAESFDTAYAIGQGSRLLTLYAKTSEHEAYDTVSVLKKKSTPMQALPQGLRDGINYDPQDPTQVTLVLRAPGKESAYVLGDFNQWRLDQNHQMMRDSIFFWTTITGLEPGRLYAFQYLLDYSIQVGDMYSELMLTPDDHWISEAVYPNRPLYPPKGKGYVSTLQTQAESFDWQVEDFQAPEKTRLIIYELLMRDFFTNGNYQNLIDTLDYLERLGVNCIELMPINEFDGNDSWGYNPAFYFAPDKAYGTAEMLKRLIDEAHQRGLAVVLDMVLNHAFGNSPTVAMYWDPTAGSWGKPSADNPWHNVDPKHPFNVGEDFNHESVHTQYLVQRVIEYWLKEYRVDGFRFDLSKGFTQKNSGTNVNAWGQYDGSRIAIWRRIYQQMQAINPNAYAILEHFADNQEEKELAAMGFLLWGNMNDTYCQLAMGYMGDNRTNLQNALASGRGWSQNHLVSYAESHDEERVAYKVTQWGNANSSYTTKGLKADRSALNACFLIPLPGPKMIWQFGEMAYDESINRCADGSVHEDCRTAGKPTHWEYMNDGRNQFLFNVYAFMNGLKLQHPAFHDQARIELKAHQNQPNSSLKWIIAKAANIDSSVVIVGNFDIIPQELPFTDFPVLGTWHDVFGDSIVLSQNQTTLSLKPGEFRVYMKAPHSKIVGIEDYLAKSNRSLRLVPNPARETVQIRTDLAQVQRIEVYTTFGLQVYARNVRISEGDYLNWDLRDTLGRRVSPGLYIVRLISERSQVAGRLVVE